VEALGDVDVVVLGELDEPVDEVELALERLEVKCEDVSGANFVTEDTNKVRELIGVRLFVKLSTVMEHGNLSTNNYHASQLISTTFHKVNDCD